MRQRNCAALLLCGPLVAGCGAASRLDFVGRSRPASAVDVSVWAGPHAVRVAPGRVRPGLVLFNITNQSGRPERFAVIGIGGLRLARTPPIGAGQTAQLKAALRGPAVALTASSGAVTRSASLDVSGPPRSGDSELTQP